MPSLPLVEGEPPDGEEDDDDDGAPEVLGCPPDWPDCWPDSPVDPGGCEEGIEGDDGEDDDDEGDDDGIDGIVGIEVELLLDAQPAAASAAVRAARFARPRVDRCMRYLGACGKPPAQLQFGSTACTWMRRMAGGSKSAIGASVNASRWRLLPVRRWHRHWLRHPRRDRNPGSCRCLPGTSVAGYSTGRTQHGARA